MYEKKYYDGTQVGSEDVDIVTDDTHAEFEGADIVACKHSTSIVEGSPSYYTSIPEGIPESNASQEDSDDVVSDHTEPALRKSGTAKASLWLQDYVANKKANGATLHTLANCISYDNVSEKYKSYLAKQSVLTEPQIFKEASHDEKWIDAMKMKIKALEDNNT